MPSTPKSFKVFLVVILTFPILHILVGMPLVINNVYTFLVYKPVLDLGDSRKESDIKVFIGIKTELSSVISRARLPQIVKTWLRDVVATPETDLKFFGRIHPRLASAIGLNTTHWVVENAPNCPRNCTELCCKDEGMFKFFLQHYVPTSGSPFSPWFCSFDDDNYVLVQNLLKVLLSLQSKNATKLYVGRPSVPRGTTRNVGKVHFLTGGAGYCITRELMDYGRDFFSNFSRYCMKYQLPDDMAIGYIVNSKLGGKQIFDEHFHSHLEKIRSSLPRQEIARQVSFGYNKKVDRSQAIEHFPNITFSYQAEEDPMLFRSLRSFLQNYSNATT